MKKQLHFFKTAVIVLGLVISYSANAFTAVTSGNWSNPATWGGVAPGTNVSGQDINIPLGLTVTLDQDVTFSGVLNTFLIDGTLSSTSNNQITISSGTMAGDGTLMIDKLTFSGALTFCTFSGDMTLRFLENQALSLGLTAMATVTDTLNLASGAINLNTNSNFTMATNSVIRVDDGSIAVSGGILNLNNAYHVLYVGSTKTTGIELNSASLQNVHVNMNNNSQTVNIGSNSDINGMLHIWMGRIGLNGNHLTLKGDIMMEDGTTISSNATSDLTIEGSGNLSDTLMFASNATINTFEVDRTGGTVKTGGDLTVNNSIKLMQGSLSLIDGSVTATAGSTIHVEHGNISENGGNFNGNASYNVEYMSNSTITSGIEVRKPGLNDVMINMQVNSSEVIFSDSVTVNGELNMTSGNLRISNNVLILNGTYSGMQNSKFIGNSMSELHLNLTSASNDTLHFVSGSNGLGKLRINTTGASNVVLGNDLQVFNEIAFLSGKLEIFNSNLIVQPTGTITGINENRYIITSGSSGSLTMNVNAGSAYVAFPVGTDDNYSPAYIQQSNSGTSGNFNVRVQNQVLSNGTFGFVSSSTAKVVDRSWFINADAGTTVNSNIKLGWVSGAELNGFNRSNAYITNYGNSGWDVMTPSSANSAANNTYELTRTGVTSFNPVFAVTEDGEPIKIETVSNTGEIRIFPNPATEFIQIENPDKSVTYKYELTDLTGRTLSTKTEGGNKFYIKDLNAGCYFIKAVNTTNNNVLVKRIIKE